MSVSFSPITDHSVRVFTTDHMKMLFSRQRTNNYLGPPLQVGTAALPIKYRDIFDKYCTSKQRIHTNTDIVDVRKRVGTLFSKLVVFVSYHSCAGYNSSTEDIPHFRSKIHHRSIRTDSRKTAKNQSKTVQEAAL